MAHLAIGHAVWPHHDILDSPGGRDAAVRDISRALAPATAHGRVDALLPSAAALTSTDVDIVWTVLDRQRQGSGGRRRDTAPGRREDLDRGQGLPDRDTSRPGPRRLPHSIDLAADGRCPTRNRRRREPAAQASTGRYRR